MNYPDYINNPEVKKKFDLLFEMNRKRFKELCRDKGIDKEHAEIISIKVASVETDFYFTDQHKRISFNDEIKKAG
jgi:hypothetical protein